MAFFKLSGDWDFSNNWSKSYTISMVAASLDRITSLCPLYCCFLVHNKMPECFVGDYFLTVLENFDSMSISFFSWPELQVNIEWPIKILKLWMRHSIRLLFLLAWAPTFTIRLIVSYKLPWEYVRSEQWCKQVRYSS